MLGLYNYEEKELTSSVKCIFLCCSLLQPSHLQKYETEQLFGNGGTSLKIWGTGHMKTTKRERWKRMFENH